MASLENVNFEVMRTAVALCEQAGNRRIGERNRMERIDGENHLFLIVRRGRNRRFGTHMPLQHSPHPTGVIGLC